MKVDYDNLTCEIIGRDSFQYEEGRKFWNRAIESYPLCIINCENKEDVIRAIKWCKKNSISFRIRSGRHHYEGYSSGNDVAVIDIRKINNIEFNEKEKTVTIGGGVRNEEIYEKLCTLGYPFPGGGCPTVGVSGLILGGGWGYSSRYFGLACDSLLEVELIDYNGDTVIANKDENADLFWACRGAGGGNFGVVTSLKLSVKEKVEDVTLINIDFPYSDVVVIQNLVKAWQEIFNEADRRFNGKLSLYNDVKKGLGVKLTALYYGDSLEANKIISPLKLISTKITCNMEQVSLFKAHEKIQYSHPEYEKYKSSGCFVYKEYTLDEINKMIKCVSEMARGAYYCAITFYGMGGAVSDISPEETSFYYRKAKFIMGFQTVWEDNKYKEGNIKWFNERFKVVRDLTEGAYVCFPNGDLEEYEREYYGKNIKKIIIVKEKYDPNNIFTFQQGIGANKDEEI